MSNNLNEQQIKEMQLDELRKLVIGAANEFYFDMDLGINIPDYLYDIALDTLQSLDPDFNIYAHVGGNGRSVKHIAEFPKGTKTKILGVDNISIRLESTSANPTGLVGQANYQNNQLKSIILWYPQAGTNGDSDYILPYTYPINKGLFPTRLNGLQQPLTSIAFSVLDANISNIEDEAYYVIDRIQLLGTFPVQEFESDWKDVMKALIADPKVTVNMEFPTESTKKDILDPFLLEFEDFLISYPWLSIVEINEDTYLTPKMDGCSIVAYYSGGKKLKVISRSDDNTGKDKTAYFDPFFPAEIPYKGDAKFMLEHVIDLRFGMGWNSRQKANGLTNSKYNQDQIAMFSTFMMYDLTDFEGKRLPMLDVGNDLIDAQADKTLSINTLNIFDERIRPVVYMDLPSAQMKYIRDVMWTWDDYLAGDLYAIPINVIPPKFRINHIVYQTEKNFNKFNQGNESKILELGLAGSQFYVKILFEGVEYLVFRRTSLENPKIAMVNLMNLDEVKNYIDWRNSKQFEYRKYYGGRYLIDGLVVHTHNQVRDKQGNTQFKPAHRIFKYAFNEIATTTITGISWDLSGYGTLIPVPHFETVNLEGSWISKCSVGGWNLLKHREIGVGSVVEVVRMNSTIPQILRVIKKVKPKLPVCEHCGRQLTEDHDIVGGVVKCNSPKCSSGIKIRRWFFNGFNYDGTKVEGPVTDRTDANLIENLPKLINVPYYNWNNYKLNQPSEVIEELFKSVADNDYDVFKDVIYHKFTNQKLNRVEFDYQLPYTFRCFRIAKGFEPIPDYIESSEINSEVNS